MSAARRVPLQTPPPPTEEERLELLQAEIRRRVGTRLKRLRTEYGLSLRAMETKVNVSAGYISEVERGLKGPTTDLLARFAHFMGVDITFFLNRED